MKDVVLIYRDTLDQWRWRRRASGNHEVIATSGEGYKDKSHAVEIAKRVNGEDVEYITEV